MTGFLPSWAALSLLEVCMSQEGRAEGHFDRPHRGSIKRRKDRTKIKAARRQKHRTRGK